MVVRTRRVMRVLALVLAVIYAGTVASGQSVGTVGRTRVFGPSLAGNLMGEPADPHVSVYLPPAYDATPARRFPVVYLLHGYGVTDLGWFGEGGVRVHAAARDALAGGAARDTILVMPNCHNAYGGCMYANSATTGYWEHYVADDLVAWVDGRYRTIARREARGIAGHGMGGHGALRIAMKRPDVFSAVYALSPCCLNERIPTADAARRVEAIGTPDSLRQDRVAQGVFARSAAWSPNPANPPFFFDLPTRDGAVQPDVLARWAAHSPAALLDSHVPHLQRLTAIALDVGDQDQTVDVRSVRQLGDALRAHGVAHTLDIYDGDHTSRLAERVETHVLPFFTEHLAFEQ